MPLNNFFPSCAYHNVKSNFNSISFWAHTKIFLSCTLKTFFSTRFISTRWIKVFKCFWRGWPGLNNIPKSAFYEFGRWRAKNDDQLHISHFVCILSFMSLNWWLSALKHFRKPVIIEVISRWEMFSDFLQNPFLLPLKLLKRRFSANSTRPLSVFVR